MFSRFAVSTAALEHWTAVFFKTVTFIIFVATIVLFVLVMLDPFHIQPKFRDQKRAQDVSQIQTWLSDYLAQPPVLTIGVSTNMQQIGESQTGCAMKTSNCSIANDVCFNLTHISPDTLLDLPQDPLVGSQDKTGYAVAFIPPNTIRVISCHAEQTQIEEGRPNEKEAAAYEKDQRKLN